jgi:hypothetical protein
MARTRCPVPPCRRGQTWAWHGTSFMPPSETFSVGVLALVRCARWRQRSRARSAWEDRRNACLLSPQASLSSPASSSFRCSSRPASLLFVWSVICVFKFLLPTRAYYQHAPITNTRLLPTRAYYQHAPITNTRILPTRAYYQHAPITNTRTLPTRAYYQHAHKSRASIPQSVSSVPLRR